MPGDSRWIKMVQNGSRDIEQIQNQIKLKIRSVSIFLDIKIFLFTTVLFQLLHVLYELKFAPLLKFSKMNRKDENSKIESILLG